jgi:hypothetical protein
MQQHTNPKGTQILKEVPCRDPEAFFSLVGTDGNGKNAFLPVGNALLGGHALLLGDQGAGKSNLMCHFLRNLRVNLGEKDVLVAFDPSGAYQTLFGQAGDVVFADDARASDGTGEAQWDLFAELADTERPLEDASALCNVLFGERIRTAREPQPVQAARDLTLALIVYLLRQDDPGLRNNETLRGLIDGFDAESMRAILGALPEFRAMTAYLSEPDGWHTTGVVTALQQAARELFQGRFNAVGTLSMRATLRQKKNKAVFVCQDPLRAGETGPAFAALLDLCFQETLTRKENEGNVYLLVDDACALPKLDHLESALRYGGARGLRVILALSGIPNLYARYGETAARAILGAFGTVVAFRLRDKAGRDFIKDLYGRRRAPENPAVQGQTPGPARRPESVRAIEDDDLTELATGESVVATGQYAPFYFRAKPYGTKR